MYNCIQPVARDWGQKQVYTNRTPKLTIRPFTYIYIFHHMYIFRYIYVNLNSIYFESKQIHPPWLVDSESVIFLCVRISECVCLLNVTYNTPFNAHRNKYWYSLVITRTVAALFFFSGALVPCHDGRSWPHTWQSYLQIYHHSFRNSYIQVYLQIE